MAADGAAAIAAARVPPGQIATLILPADTAWNEGSGPVEVPPAPEPAKVFPEAVAEAARAKFEGMPGLRSKAFTIDPVNREALNFYLWESEEPAKAFFSPQLVDRVTELYGVRPTVEFVDVVALVENRAS